MPETGLSLEKVTEFQRIVHEECGVELPLEEAWTRANRLVALYRMLMKPIPEDPGSEFPDAGSNLDHLA